MNYFELLRFSPAFNIDLGALESTYFAEQQKYHPDRFAGKATEERHHALQRSMDINKAYQTLKNPLSRAQYLLQLEGIAVGTEKDNVKPSQAVLIEAMELREEPPTKEQLEQMITKSISAIAQYFDHSAFNDMAQETLRLGYLIKAKR